MTESRHGQYRLPECWWAAQVEGVSGQHTAPHGTGAKTAVREPLTHGALHPGHRCVRLWLQKEKTPKQAICRLQRYMYLKMI